MKGFKTLITPGNARFSRRTAVLKPLRVRSRPLRWVGSSVSGMRFGLTLRTRRRTRRSDKPPGKVCRNDFRETPVARTPAGALPKTGDFRSTDAAPLPQPADGH